ncbi:mannitol dehydrogenase family protein [Pseudogemmobacter blasticus]|uniref:Mannitol dehydrogenase family protein n=1 Tax=Fuscovulum blasticum DSM 2131 TaxID=1188250 RepID=A0A2T4J439_FUSBL|nr:mannitol dehydrogenase family protein [Fuscovulum blasticum]PTE12623.1 mannitol dehydrogenase family protein [Fuscovulum blasticum DSM 2131]
MIRLSSGAVPQGAAEWPGYTPEAHGTGIVHLGLGNFARAHLLAYTDAALALQGGNWRVTGVSLRGTAVADSLIPQDGRYTLVTRGETVSARVIGALADVLAGANVGAAALAAMGNPACRIVSLTVTEKGYGITSTGGLDRNHPAVKADLARPDAPSGVIGLIAAALAARRAANLAPFTVLSCDNLSHNGQKLRTAVLEFATACHGPDLADWIATRASFPSTMVDRITPAATPATAATAAALTGHSDLAAVETEPFTQWVIEDDFCAGRPAWHQTGALFVRDVAPYEQMKLRMLNGAHSMLAYSGQLAGRAYVRDVMADPAHAALVRRHLAAAAATVQGLTLDLDAYAQALCDRFRNPAIAHATAQIAMDGTQKLPQRITAPALQALAAGTATRPFAFALAAWLAWLARRDALGQPIPVDDPKAAPLAAAVVQQTTPAGLIRAVAGVCPDILPEPLQTGPFGAELCALLDNIQTQGMTAVIAREAAP